MIKFSAEEVGNKPYTVWMVVYERQDEGETYDVFEDPSKELCELVAEFLNTKNLTLKDIRPK